MMKNTVLKSLILAVGASLLVAACGSSPFASAGVSTTPYQNALAGGGGR